MKILFCIYQLDFADHISLSYLSAIAKNRGHETYFTLLESFEESLKNTNPDIVAYSLNIFGMNEIIENHKKIKEKYSFKSIAGGPGVTFNSDAYKDSQIDVFCIGEGEYAFDEYLSKMEKGESVDNILNLITKNNKNIVRPWIKNLDTLPFPDRDITLANSYLKDTPKKTFYATRGCPFSCYYCANNYYNELYKGKGKIIRRFSPERLIEEIKYVGSRYRMDFVKFGDDLFALKADDWLRKFSELYKKEINIPFNCFLRFDTVTDELLQLLKDCNCYSVHLSVDSTSEHVREKILGRKMRKVNIEENLKLIHSYGIKTWVNFMLAAPDSTLEDDLSTIELSYKSNVTYAAYATTVPMKGTKLYDYVMEHGLINEEYISDMIGCTQKSMLNSLSEKEKNIRYNIYLVGPLISKFPNPFRQIAIFIIKHTKPNKLYILIRKLYYTYNIENVIFKLDKTRK